MNWLLIGVNLVVFLAQAGWPVIGEQLLLNSRDPHLLQFVTYAFLHLSWWHLLGNVIVLALFGGNVNDRLGPLGYLAFYLAGAVFAATAFVFTQRSGAVMGASGAAGAVMGAYLALLPRSNVTVSGVLIAVRGFELPSMLFILIYFLFNLSMSLAAPAGVAYVAHLAGMVLGFVVCVGLLWLGLLSRSPWDFLGLAQRWRRRRQYRALVRAGYDPFAAPGDAVDRERARESEIRNLRAAIDEAMSQRDIASAARLFLRLKQADDAQLLPRQHQLDVANHLASERQYTPAAEAYEQFLSEYPSFDQAEQVQLMLGVIYARYLRQYDKARHHLRKALPRLHSAGEADMARAELVRIEAFLGGGV